MVSIKVALLLAATSGSAAFVIQPASRSASSTRVYIDKQTANSIDAEFDRQHHKQEYEQQWMEKNRGAVMQSLHRGGGINDQTVVSDLEEQHETMRQLAKDKRLAKEDPQRYCADRCLSTGNCDVYEDILEMSPEEVMEFCNDCVLGEGEEPCDIPDGSFDKLSP